MNTSLVRPLLQSRSGEEIATEAAWLQKREDIRSKVLSIIGNPPVDTPVAKYKIYEDVTEPLYRQLKIGYEVEPGEEVRAYLLIPPAAKRKKGAAVLCQHGTSPEAKETQLGKGEKPGRDYGARLAKQGFVTLSPDHVCAGERLKPGYRPYDTAPFYEGHPEWSAVGKAIWDGQRAIDVLQLFDEVDPERIGTVGHSLGGHGAMFVSAFDERVKAAVSSCGMAIWANNPKRLNWARTEWYCYFPKLRQVFESDAELPFDLHEFAALVAPRAFLNISGMGDAMYGNNDLLPEMGRQLDSVFRLLNSGDRFANFLFGEGHDVPVYSQMLTTGWFEKWLVEV